MKYQWEPNEYEVLVMKMANDELPWEKGAWVNACVDFLQEQGCMTIDGKLTVKGHALLEMCA